MFGLYLVVDSDYQEFLWYKHTQFQLVLGNINIHRVKNGSEVIQWDKYIFALRVRAGFDSHHFIVLWVLHNFLSGEGSGLAA